MFFCWRKRIETVILRIMDGTQRIRALNLLSGGLDSQLAACLLRDQGIEVDAVVLESPFFGVAGARAAAGRLGIPLHVINFSKDITSLLDNPKHGFGPWMNPCIDCHARMLRRAGELMEEMGFHFLSTGEVLNKGSMSHGRENLELIARESGYGDLVVRPLSARLLLETKPERRGWIDRSRMLSIEGRGRKRQLRMAEIYEIDDFQSRSGICRLTDPDFCKRLKDLKDHEGLNGERSLTLLRFGRHFRLTDNIKIIVGRNESDNAFLEGNAELYDLVLKMDNVPGPTGLLPFTAGEEQIRLGAAICARYSDSPPGNTAAVKIRSSRGVTRIEIMPAGREETDRLRI